MFTSTLRGRRLVIPISLTLKRLHQQQPRPAEPPARAKRPERPVAGLFCKLAEAPVCPTLPWKKPRLRGAPPAPPPLSSASLCRLRFSEPASGTRRPPSQITLHTPCDANAAVTRSQEGTSPAGRSPLLALGDVGFSTSTAPTGSGPSPEAVLARRRAVPARSPSARAASGPQEASPLCLKTGFRSLRLGSHRGPLYKAPKPALQLLICEIGPGKLGGYTDAAGRQAIQRNAQKSRETRRHLLS